MSHFSEYETAAHDVDNRNLGDEWADWKGEPDPAIEEGKGLFLWIAGLVTLAIALGCSAFVYLVSPRLAMWWTYLPAIAWIAAGCFIALDVLWYLLLLATVGSGRRVGTSPARARVFFEATFAGAFRIARALRISRDRLGHSFVMTSNAIARATKPLGRQEKLLLLLPRCLEKEQLRRIGELKERYPIAIHTVSGGELARKKVKELAPTAIIGVACERDLVSGIRDVGTKFSVIGIPNRRPHGPCKETSIDMAELIEAIEFFVGPPKDVVR
jgi:uncharacterized protein